MIEPIAEVVKDERLSNPFIHSLVALNKLPDGTKLTTVADVLAALREPNVAMSSAGARIFSATPTAYQMNLATAIFFAMLDQFERDQGSAT